jgi:cytochrome P450 family 6
MELIFAETLRLYSPIGQLFRTALSDYKVPGSDLTIEKGTPIMIPVHAIHHDSRYYYDPERFDPERFAPDEVKKRPNLCFLPFGD